MDTSTMGMTKRRFVMLDSGSVKTDSAATVMPKAYHSAGSGKKNGANGEIRTHDLLFTKWSRS